MIEVRNLTKKYGNNIVVNHLNFTIEPGKIYGFLGPNGAGKSTTMNMITGCLAATEGEILLDGHDIYSDAVEAKRCIGYLPEVPPLYPDMTPMEYLRFVAEAKGIRQSEIFDQIFKVMEETNILSMKDRLIKNLSKGFRQRVGIAQAMLGDPKLIILDEPTVGLDPQQIIEIRDLIINLGASRTIILSSHILAEVSAVCDHVMIIKKGNLVASDTLENIRRDNTTGNHIEITARANSESIEKILNEIPGVISYTITEQIGASNIYDVSIDAEEDRDIREKLFLAFADKHFTLLKLASTELTLEEVFLKLTSDDDYYDESDEDDDDEGGDEGGDDDDEEKEDDDETPYVPLFGAARNDENDDHEDDKGDDDR